MVRYFDAYTRPPREPRSRGYHACEHCYICILVRCLCGSEVIVTSIHEERNQNLWFCNNVVLVRYFDAYTPPPHEPRSRGYHACKHCFICILVRSLCSSEVIVTSIHEERNQNLWICNKVVLVRYFDAYTRPPHEPRSRAYHACKHCFTCILVRCLCSSEVFVTSIHEERNQNL